MTAVIVRKNTWRAASVVALSALALAACANPTSSSSSGSPAPSASKAEDLAAKVPAALKSKGTILIATDASYAPNEFKDADNKTIIGFDVDLGTAIAQKLGLKAQFQNAQFDGILAGLSGGKFDMSMSSFTDTKEREKAVDFVTYFVAGTSLVVKGGNPEGIKSKDDLCGKTVAAEKGTTQLQQIADLSKTCTTAGKAAIKGQEYPDQNAVTLAVDSGKAAAYLADSPVASYAAKQTKDKFEGVGDSFGNAPYGIAIPKTSGTLKDAVLGAVKALIADGTYQKILDKWSLGKGAITDPVINGAVG